MPAYSTTKPRIQSKNLLKSNNFAIRRAFIFVLTVLLFPFVTNAQTSNPVFNWKVKEISPGNKLQGMSLHDENTAVIAGFGATAKITRDKGVNWNDVGLFNPLYNFIDISINGQVGFLTARKTVLVKFPKGGEDNVYTNGLVLKTIDGGKNWSQIDLSKIGAGTDPATNPGQSACYSLNPYSVLCINDTTALVFMQWYDVSSGATKTHSAVFKTVNGGDSWTPITQDLKSAYVTAIKMIGTDIYIGGNKILLKASAANDSITDLFPAFSAVAGEKAFVYTIRYFAPNDLYVVTTTGVYNTTDGGQTFTKINGLNGGYDFFKLDDQVKIVLGASSLSRATTNGGTSWANCSPGYGCYNIPGIFNDSLYALSSSVVFKISVNDLKSGNYKWHTQTITPGTLNLQKMWMFDDSNALLIGDDGTVKRTTDKGITWTDAALPKIGLQGPVYDFRSVSASGNSGWLTTRRMTLAQRASGESYYMNGLIFKTDDAWKTWSLLNNKNIGKDTPTDASRYPLMEGCYGMDNYTIAGVDDQTAYVYASWSDTISVQDTVTRHSRVYKTIDGGDSWMPVTKDFGGSFVMSIKFSGDTGYIAGNKILLRTEDGGKSFTDLYPALTVGTDSNLVISAVSMRTPDEVYFQTSNNKGVFYTRDGGSTFSKLNGVSGGLDFVVLDNNSFLSLGSASANKFTNDGGVNWQSSNLSVPAYAAGEVLNDSLYVLGKSNVYKIAIADLDIKTLGVKVGAPSPLRVLYGTSALKLVSADGNIDRCLVYTISGQLIAVNEPKSTSCSLQYNSFTPGVYIISALIEGKKYTQKVILK